MWPQLIKKQSFIFLLMLAMVCVISTQGAWAGLDYGGILRVAEETDSFGFDVIKARGFSSSGQMIGNLVMERLFELGPDNKLIPVLGCQYIMIPTPIRAIAPPIMSNLSRII